MNFKEIIDLAYNIIDEVDYDEQVEIIVKGAINEAYFDMAKIDMRLSTSYTPIIRKIATLPTDCIKVVEVTPALDSTDKVVGNSIITNKTGTLEILYATPREELVNDNDEPDLHNTLIHNLANFACYKYWLHRKKIDVANAFLQKYMNEKHNFETMVKDMGCVMDAVTIEY